MNLGEYRPAFLAREAAVLQIVQRNSNATPALSPMPEKVIALAQLNVEFEFTSDVVSGGKSNLRISRVCGRRINTPLVPLET